LRLAEDFAGQERLDIGSKGLSLLEGEQVQYLQEVEFADFVGGDDLHGSLVVPEVDVEAVEAVFEPLPADELVHLVEVFAVAVGEAQEEPVDALAGLAHLVPLLIQDELGGPPHQVADDQAVLGLSGAQEAALDLHGVLEVLEGALVVHVLAAAEGGLVPALFGHAQVLGVEPAELGRSGRLLLLRLRLLLPHEVVSLHEEGLVEESLARPVVPQDALDDPVAA
jgi:hypothetical protein